ncbi:glutathione S-transferase [Comamonas sediminis]|uniref:glutathione S-transferase n=1 Tax=Comamonas sediminis TaxID=1783360 RepID=UPI003D2C7FD4
MLKIWGRISSINVRKAVWAAQEVGVAFERIDAGGKFGGTQTPEYLARNPNAMVPAIEDGEGAMQLTLFESNVIVRYLCARYSPGVLYPAALAQRFDAERWMDWQQTTMNPAGRDAFIQLIRTAPEQRDAQKIAASIAAMEPLLQLLDRHLANRPYLQGAQFGMADIPVACEVHRWWNLPAAAYQRPHYPHVERWFAAILARPASRGVLDIRIE